MARKFGQGPNKYPSEVSEPAKFRSVMDEYHDAMTSLSIGILRMLARTLGLAETAFDAFCVHPIAILRLLHYPPQDPDNSDIERGKHYFPFLMISPDFSWYRNWRSY